MKKSKILALLFVIPTLCSFVPRNQISFYSEVGNKEIFAADRVSAGKVSDISIKTKNYSDTAIKADFCYELFDFPSSYVYTGDLVQYTLFFRTDFYLNAQAHYRGAFLDALEYYNPAYLRSYSLSTSVSGIDDGANLSHVSLEGNASDLYSLYVNPTYSSDAMHNNSEWNNMERVTNSYIYPKGTEKMPSCDHHLDAYVDQSWSSGVDSRKTPQKSYKRMITYPSDFMAGPQSNQSRDYNFSVFDSVSFASSKKPSRLSFEFDLLGMYGQNTWRAYFYGSSSCTKYFDI